MRWNRRLTAIFKKAEKFINELKEEFSLNLEYDARARGQEHPFRGGLHARLIEYSRYRAPRGVILLIGVSSLSGLPQIALKFGEGGAITHAHPLCRADEREPRAANVILYAFYSQLLPYELDGHLINYTVFSVQGTAKISVGVISSVSEISARHFLPQSDKIGAALKFRDIILMRDGKVVVTPTQWQKFLKLLKAMDFVKKL